MVAPDAPPTSPTNARGGVSQGPKLRMLYGRGYHDNPSNDYALPADDQEHSRLDLQHEMWKIYLDELYPEPEYVRKVLAPNPVRRPAVLDIGAGSGRWAIEMAEEFPQADVVGLDIVQPRLVAHGKPVPSNCRFVLEDADDGLQQYESSFDVIHGRFIHGGVKDSHALMFACARALRPGGILILIHGVAHMLKEDGTPYPLVEEGQPGFSWYQSASHKVFDSGPKAMMLQLASAAHWNEWLCENPNYEGAKERKILLPVSVFRPGLDEKSVRVSTLFRENTLQVLSNFRSIILSGGADEASIDYLLENAKREISEQKLEGYFAFGINTAIRINGPWVPREGGKPNIDIEEAKRVIFGGQVVL
ncbi:hypothetical protein FRB99_003533 [Tulasnella sp. 403]|nr:hypothetical protein FRB99_003533 [Tulasnella sp. 403]